MSFKKTLQTALIAMGVVSFSGLSMAATTQNAAINYQFKVRPTLIVSCPGSVVDLGEYDVGDTPTGTTVTCSVIQNRASGTLSITSAPASNSLTLTEPGSDTYTVNFSGYAYAGSASISGDFAGGVSVTDPPRGARDFTWSATPAGPVPNGQAAGTYTGSQTLTFSLI